MNKRGHFIYQCLGILAILVVWQGISLFFSPLVVPPISDVVVALGNIAREESFTATVLLTISRLIAGLIFGIVLGLIIGLFSGFSAKCRAFFSPFLSIMQSVPPVCWVVLALVWFGFNGKPCIFIVTVATIPTIAINTSHGVANIDKALLEMAKLYEFTKKEVILDIIMPSIKPYFLSALEIVIGGGWKLAVMGEVLTTTTGIGGKITMARLNIEPAVIIAWAFILVVCSFLTSKLLTLIFLKRRRRVA